LRKNKFKWLYIKTQKIKLTQTYTKFSNFNAFLISYKYNKNYLLNNFYMKKIIFIIFIIFINFLQVSADSNPVSDSTVIDCVNWDNDTWVPFDSTKSYATLKAWIENTINYINSNINKAWNEASASWKIFNIKVKCSFDDILNKSINLNFDGVAFNNELIIEWIDDNSFIIKEVDFKLWYKAGNIIFKNAQFLNENKPYFYDFIPLSNEYTPSHPISYGIKIINSYISLKNANNIWQYIQYKSFLSKYYNQRSWKTTYYYEYPYNYTNKQIIENSIIDIEIWNNFDFKMPVFLKNSKINFINKDFNWPYNINFLEVWNTYNWWNLNQSVFVSNQIDLWWNHIFVKDTDKISFLNNEFTNLENLSLSWSTVFINNYFENNSSIDISFSKQLYNNIFKSGFTDTYDISNNRKNFSSTDAWSKWLGWVYKRLRSNKFFNIDISSSSLYKEILWVDLEKWLWDIYVIFNY
jgi:hypothetical protein